MTAEEYFGNWLRVIDKEEMSKVLNNIKAIRPDKLCPSYFDIFKAFNLCSYDNCKIVFLGQDPYPQPGVATGICFGNKADTKDISPSLSVLKECCINYELPHGPIEFDVTLESWAKQGILMLNSALTCEVGKPSSHTMLWRPFIAKFLKVLSENRTGLIYVLFGSKAQTFKPYINAQFNSIIEVEHPAMFARNNQIMPYRVFIDINNLVKAKYNTTIQWYIELITKNTSKDETERIDGDDFFWPCSL